MSGSGTRHAAEGVGTLPGSHWINGSFPVKWADASMQVSQIPFLCIKNTCLDITRRPDL